MLDSVAGVAGIAYRSCRHDGVIDWLHGPVVNCRLAGPLDLGANDTMESGEGFENLGMHLVKDLTPSAFYKHTRPLDEQVKYAV